MYFSSSIGVYTNKSVKLEFNQNSAYSRDPQNYHWRAAVLTGALSFTVDNGDNCASDFSFWKAYAVYI